MPRAETWGWWGVFRQCLVCVFVCLYPINAKTAEPIGPKFCVGHHVTPGKVYSQGQELPQSFKIRRYLLSLKSYYSSTSIRTKYFNFRTELNYAFEKMAVIFNTFVKEKEVNPVSKENVHILITKYYRLEKFQTKTKLQQFKMTPCRNIITRI